MARILITGANGHLGRRLIQTVAADHQVHALVRRAQARDMLLKRFGEHGNVTVTIVDPRDPSAVARAAEGCEQAVHLIGTIKASRAVPYEQTHQQPAHALVEAANTIGLTQIVYVSILGADGSSDCACLRHRAAVESAFNEAAPAASIIRVPMVLGERDRAGLALARRAASKRAILFRGTSLEQPIYAGDVIDAMVNALATGGPDNKMFELAGPESVSRRELVLRAAKTLDKKPKIYDLPLAVGMFLAAIGELLSATPPVTRDMLKILDHDDRIDPAPAAAALGITLTSLDETLRRCITKRLDQDSIS